MSGDVFWGKQKSFDLPPETKRFVLKVSQANGNIEVTEGTSSHDWLTTSYNAEATHLILKPKKIVEAFK